ncbi:MAG: nucleotidyltransferase family protein [Gammaproteobacteria bacterium]|nr:nucleotidyltransferase family protein [Gammaproteobacteria bacterium]
MRNKIDFSPEQRLLLCCARLEVSSDVVSEIESLVHANLNWNQVIAYAAWHQITPMLYRTLSRFIPDHIPSAVKLVFELHIQRYSEQYRQQFHELLHIIERLESNGIPVISFKGPTLARLIYDDLSLRPFSDLDFLLHPSDVDRALRLLESLGYVAPSSRTGKQERYFRRYACQYKIGRHDGEVWIEPHWTLAQRVFAIDLDYQALWQRSIQISWEGTLIRTFAIHDQPLVLCVHGFREQWRRLKWICDIAELLRQNVCFDWSAIFREARLVGCERILRLGLTLANDLLDAPVPDHLVHSPDPQVAALVARIRSNLFQIDLPIHDIWTIDVFHLLGRERLRDKLSYALRTQLAPRLVFFERIPVPDSLFFCYYPIRWIHDYLLLPGWSIWKRAQHE